MEFKVLILLELLLSLYMDSPKPRKSSSSSSLPPDQAADFLTMRENVVIWKYGNSCFTILNTELEKFLCGTLYKFYLWWGLIGASVGCCTTTLGSFLILFSLLCWYQALYTRNPVRSLANPRYFLWNNVKWWNIWIKSCRSYFFLLTTGIPSWVYSEMSSSLIGFSTLYWLGYRASLLVLSNSRIVSYQIDKYYFKCISCNTIWSLSSLSCLIFI